MSVVSLDVHTLVLIFVILCFYRVRKLNEALPLVIATDEAVAAAKKAKRALSSKEQALVNKVTALVNDLVQVNDQVNAFDKLGKENYEEDSYT